MPHISIDNGRLVLEYKFKKRTQRCSFCATAYGAELMGQKLCELEYGMWTYSSSVDFPDENGAPDLDFRLLIETAYNKYDMGFV
jgi:hypothetical protein